MKYILISFLLVVLAYFGALMVPLNALRSLFLPVQVGLTKQANDINDAFGFYTTISKIRSEDILLRQKILQLQEEIVTLKMYRNENSLLRQQLALRASPEESFGYLEAYVMANPSDLSEGTVILNKGTKDGVRNGDLVVIGKFLIGFVKSSDYASSICELITSSSSNLTGYDIDSPNLSTGLISGQHGSYLSFDRLLKNEKVSIGDVVVTSGKDGRYPPDLIVGKVESITDDPSQPLKSARLVTLIDFSKITKVFIEHLQH